MDPLNSLHTSSLSLCGILALLRGNQIYVDIALEECLTHTKNIDKTARVLVTVATYYSKAIARIYQENYKLK